MFDTEISRLFIWAAFHVLIVIEILLDVVVLHWPFDGKWCVRAWEHFIVYGVMAAGLYYRLQMPEQVGIMGLKVLFIFSLVVCILSVLLLTWIYYRFFHFKEDLY